MPIDFKKTFAEVSYRGLSSLDAEVRAKEYGKNVRPVHKRKNGLRRLWDIVSEPMVVLLVGTTVIYYFIGSRVETLIFAFTIIPVVAIEFFQERKTDKAIELLDKMLIEECQVYRDGAIVKLPSTEIVPGDLVHISAGDKVPADGILVRSSGLLVDEAVLTGESIPVIKAPSLEQSKEKEQQLFQGTMVVQGEGQFVVLATGGDTEYGRIGNLLEGIDDEPTPLQKKIHQLIKQVAVGAIIIALFVGIVLGQQQGIVKGLLGTLTIAMSIIPEELPIVFSVFLIMGVWRLSKRRALVRKMVMVESLGSVTVICADKTGTLTEGKMSLDKFYIKGRIWDVKGIEDKEIVKPLVEGAVLAMERVAVDPMEVEMQRYAKETGYFPGDLHANYTLKKDSTFNAKTKTVSHIWENSSGSFQFTAGAPESIVEICAWKAQEKEAAIKAYEQLAFCGYRVIGIAKSKAESRMNFSFSKMEFVGFVALSDPPREGVKDAVGLCKTAGIRVMMITGDHAYTAKSIADQVGIVPEGEVVDGEELDSMSLDSLQDLVRTRNIFARVRPEQKYMIVEALQANEEIVAMTGDGVNDAPALKKATIGIAMGENGTAVARAASGMVLMDDNFTTIVGAVEEGRRIYANLQKAFLFLFSFHLPIIGLAIIPLLFGQGLYFLPIHIIFLEFFGDPTTVIGLEKDPISPGVMKQPPRPINEPFLNRSLIWQISWQAAGILGLSLWFYGQGLINSDISVARTMSFVALVTSQIILVIINRDWVQVKSNITLWFLLIVTFGILNLIIFTPWLSNLFHFSPLTPAQYYYTLLSSFLVMLFFNRISKGV